MKKVWSTVLKSLFESMQKCLCRIIHHTPNIQSSWQWISFRAAPEPIISLINTTGLLDGLRASMSITTNLPLNTAEWSLNTDHSFCIRQTGSSQRKSATLICAIEPWNRKQWNTLQRKKEMNEEHGTTPHELPIQLLHQVTQWAILRLFGLNPNQRWNKVALFESWQPAQLFTVCQCTLGHWHSPSGCVCVTERQ